MPTHSGPRSASAARSRAPNPLWVVIGSPPARSVPHGAGSRAVNAVNEPAGAQGWGPAGGLRVAPRKGPARRVSAAALGYRAGWGTPALWGTGEVSGIGRLRRGRTGRAGRAGRGIPPTAVPAGGR